MFKRIAVLGAGNGGKMMAAELSTAGWEVNLFEIPEFAKRNLEKIKETGGVEVNIENAPENFEFPAGGKPGFNKITGKITTNIEKALKDVDLIMLPIPAFARKRFIIEAAPYLKDGQTVIIWPGYFGALQFASILKNIKVDIDINICETESLIYACKSSDPTIEGGLDLISLKDAKKKLNIATFPSNRINNIITDLKGVYPAFQKANNVIQTTIENANPVIHPQSVLLNLYLVERKFFPFFEQIGGGRMQAYNITPGSASVMESIDNERINIAKALEIDCKPLWETLKKYYNCSGNNLYEVLLSNKAYQNSLAPTSLKNRFIYEDIPYGLIPLASLGNILKVKVDTINAMCTIASAATGINLWKEGLDIKDIGIEESMTSLDIINYVS